MRMGRALADVSRKTGAPRNCSVARMIPPLEVRCCECVEMDVNCSAASMAGLSGRRGTKSSNGQRAIPVRRVDGMVWYEPHRVALFAATYKADVPR